jgi:hypothetical protein
VALEAQRMLALQMRADCDLRRLAMLEELSEVERRVNLIVAEFDVLDGQIQVIEAQIAQAAKWGAA